MDTVVVAKPKKKLLEYKLNKEIQYSKNGSFEKTKTLYCLDPKEIRWADLEEYEKDVYELMDLIDVYEKKGQRLLPEQEITVESIAESEKQVKLLKEKLTHDEIVSLMVYNKLSLAKDGGLPTYQLLKQVENIIEKFMFADKELTVPVTKSDMRRALGLEYSSIVDFFLGEAILPYFVSETQKFETA